ncbi:DUF2269 family protein [Chryseobacterium lathyri]|jgi:uncharacterized membrane protein|uniref:DUF2269 domain-containing protein n=1 Tax=Chryseobacterium lathyri TaxID=395933 RepID=A0A511YDS7_9FLAO|nr:DUF2269 family protein [Chryseobacterium lathyri]GEN73347.1 hypothetical protein CLA01_34190 [Chryseobacterium lathyri]
MYLFLKLLHILSVIIAIGSNLSYFIWLQRSKQQQYLLFSLKGIKFLDEKIANPAYFISLFTGLCMCYIRGINPLNIDWLFFSLLLFSMMGIVGLGLYSSALSNQIKMLERYDLDPKSYYKAEKKQTIVGIILIIIALIIVTLMVFKPSNIIL